MHERSKVNEYGSCTVDKRLTSEGVRDAVKFYLETNSTWKYHELIEHLRTSFESGKTFSSLVRDFYSCVQ